MGAGVGGGCVAVRFKMKVRFECSLDLQHLSLKENNKMKMHE